MDTADLTRAMGAATADLAPRPGFTDDVLRGAKRRRNRRRAGGALALAAVLGVVTIATSLPDTVTVPAAPGAELWKLVDRPTRGELADDSAYLAEVRQAWLTGMDQSPNHGDRALTGETRIVWAGETPAGRTALVAQRGEGGVALGVVAGNPPVVVTSSPAGVRVPPAFLFGPEDRVLLALDGGTPLQWSRWVEKEDGRGERAWQPIPVEDGVALVHLPEGAPPTAEVMADSGLLTLRASAYKVGFDLQSKPIPVRTVDWPQHPKLGLDSAKSPSLLDRDLPDQFLIDQGYLDPRVKALVTGFHVVADLPDGRSVTAFEMVPAMNARSRFYAVIQSPDGTPVSVTYGGPIDRDAALPAKVRLPDGQGWIVAAYGSSLAFRADEEAQWQPLGKDAALVPDTGQVQVSTPGKEPVVVNLG